MLVSFATFLVFVFFSILGGYIARFLFPSFIQMIVWDLKLVVKDSPLSFLYSPVSQLVEEEFSYSPFTLIHFLSGVALVGVVSLGQLMLATYRVHGAFNFGWRNVDGSLDLFSLIVCLIFVLIGVARSIWVLYNSLHERIRVLSGDVESVVLDVAEAVD